EVRPTRGRRARVVDVRDVRMAHAREGLALGLEARDERARVEPELHELERDFAADRDVLLGEEHDAHAAFAQRPHDAVRSDARRLERALAVARRGIALALDRRGDPDGAGRDRAPRVREDREQALDRRAQLAIVAARRGEIRLALALRPLE